MSLVRRSDGQQYKLRPLWQGNIILPGLGAHIDNGTHSFCSVQDEASAEISKTLKFIYFLLNLSLQESYKWKQGDICFIGTVSYIITNEQWCHLIR